MNQSVNPLLSILSEENKILDEVILNQVSFRQAVTQKNWQILMSLSSSIGKLMDTFNSLDEKREELMQDKKELMQDKKEFTKEQNAKNIIKAKIVILILLKTSIIILFLNSKFYLKILEF